MIAAVPLFLFPFCLIAAALSDARRFIIPNGLSIALTAGFCIAAIVTGMDWATLGNHLATAAAVLTVCFGLFCFNAFGAGDGKLLASVALWFGWPTFLTTAMAISLLGGALCLGILGAQKAPTWFPSIGIRIPALARLAMIEKLKCPYGVAISAGALLTFRESPLFHALFAQMG